MEDLQIETVKGIDKYAINILQVRKGRFKACTKLPEGSYLVMEGSSPSQAHRRLIETIWGGWAIAVQFN